MTAPPTFPEAEPDGPVDVRRPQSHRVAAWTAGLLLAAVSAVLGCRIADTDAVTPVPQVLAFLPWLLVPAAAGLLLACGESRPPAPVVELPTSGDTVTTADSDVTGAAWLGGDRWGVLAAPNETAGIVDFSNRKLQPSGGGRSRELGSPTTLFARGDSLYIGDWVRRRTTLWTSDGRLVRSYPTTDAARGALRPRRPGTRTRPRATRRRARG